MNSYRRNARIVGVLLIAAIVAPLLSFPFTRHVDTPDYLINVAANENQVIIGALFDLICAGAFVVIAVVIFPILRKHNEALALGAVGFRIIEGVLHIVGVVGLLSLVTLSQEYVKAGAPDASYFQSLGTLLLAARDWAGVLGSFAFILGALMYYYIFYQSKLIPRWLSGWGFIGATLSLAAGLLGMFGFVIEFSEFEILWAPLALNEMVLGVWLIVKGFNPSAIASGSAKTDIN